MQHNSKLLCDLGRVQFPVYKMAMVIFTLQNMSANQFAQSLTCHRSSISKYAKFSIVVVIVIMAVTDKLPPPMALD